MKKVRYDGEDERIVTLTGDIVNTGDVIEVPDEFEAFNFSPVEKASNTKDVPQKIAGTEIQADPIFDTLKETK